MNNQIVAQVGIMNAWRNKFRPATPYLAGPNLFGLVQTGQLPAIISRKGFCKISPAVC